MIKRPLNARFSDAVIEGIKTTTIRNKAWPVGKPIMLYNWSGAPYRSKQIDVAAVIVDFVRPITIKRPACDLDLLSYDYGPYLNGRWLWEHEGFKSPFEMDDWFSKIVKPGQSATLSMMIFRLANVSSSATPPSKP